MCDPITMGTIAVLSATISAAESYQAVKANNEAVEAQAEQLNKATAFQYDQLAVREAQEQRKADANKLARERVMRRQLGRMRAAAAESGLSGATMERRDIDPAMQNMLDQQIIETNRDVAVGEVRSQTEAAHMSANNQYLGLKSQLKEFDPWMESLKIGVAGAQGAVQGASAKTSQK